MDHTGESRKGRIMRTVRSDDLFSLERFDGIGATVNELQRSSDNNPFKYGLH